jgi:hypothetical protein
MYKIVYAYFSLKDISLDQWILAGMNYLNLHCIMSRMSTYYVP